MLALSLLVVTLLALTTYTIARTRAISAAGGSLGVLHSRPSYHGLYALLWVLIIGLGAYLLANFALSTYVASRLRS